jgi:hypothetical protein
MVAVTKHVPADATLKEPELIAQVEAVPSETE